MDRKIQTCIKWTEKDRNPQKINRKGQKLTKMDRNEQ